MTAIAASLVKELRDVTGAGMMDCKRALEETGGDVEAARTLLREKGMAQAGKRAGRATTEGLVGYLLEGGRATLVAVGCETEPVAKNDEFLAFAEKVLRTVDASGPEAAGSLDPERVALVARIGENVAVVGAERYEAGEGELLAAYVHPPANKIGVLVKVAGGTPELARQLAMHIAFAAPEWATRDDAPADLVAAEREIYANSDEVCSKPEGAREKIVDGMLAKRFFAAQPGGVLADQPWIHDPSLSVGKAFAEAGARVVAFRRLSVAG